MIYRELRNGKRNKKKKMLMFALVAATVLTGCGNTDGTEGVPTESPVGIVMPEDLSLLEKTEAPTAEPVTTEEPVVSEEPAATEAPAATAEPTVSPEPTATPQPYNPEVEGYPELKADGRSWGLSYRESGLQPWGNETPKNLAAYNAYYV